MKKLFIPLLLLLGSVLNAQEDGKAWLDRMNRAYAAASSVSFHFSVEYYATRTQPAATTTMKGEVRYAGTNYYSDAMGQVVVVNKKYMLLIDKTQQTITCLPGAGKTRSQNSAPAGPDSSWGQAAKIRLLTAEGPFRRVEVTSNDPVYEKTEITINATTYALEQVIFYYKKQENGSQPRLAVNYSDVKLNGGWSEADFSEKKYVQKKSGTWIATPAWSNYKIIDLTSEQPE